MVGPGPANVEVGHQTRGGEWTLGRHPGGSAAARKQTEGRGAREGPGRGDRPGGRRKDGRASDPAAGRWGHGVARRLRHERPGGVPGAERRPGGRTRGRAGGGGGPRTAREVDRFLSFQGRSELLKTPTSARLPGSWPRCHPLSSVSNWPAAATPPTPSTSASLGRRSTAPVSGSPSGCAPASPRGGRG